MIEHGSRRHRFGVWLMAYSVTIVGNVRSRWWLPMLLIRWVEFRIFLFVYHIGACIAFGFKKSLKAVVKEA